MDLCRSNPCWLSTVVTENGYYGSISLENLDWYTLDFFAYLVIFFLHAVFVNDLYHRDSAFCYLPLKNVVICAQIVNIVEDHTGLMKPFF